MKLLIFSFCCVLALGFPVDEPTFRIYNGAHTTIEQHPYQVALEYLRDGLVFFCGGSILNKDTIVTAAHCIYGLVDYKTYSTVRVGSIYRSKGGEEYKVAKIFMHEKYNITGMEENDVAVLKLDRPLTYSNKVQPIELQPEQSPVPEGTEVVLSGWGLIDVLNNVYPENLRTAKMHVVSNAYCQLVYSFLSVSITDDMLCAKDDYTLVSHGDSGGPLVANGKLIGIISFGFRFIIGTPTVYANVSTLYPFITQYL